MDRATEFPREAEQEVALPGAQGTRIGAALGQPGVLTE